MAHVSEDRLLLFVLDRTLANDADAIERHFGECEECRERLQSIRRFDEALRDPDTWAAAPESPGFDELRRLAENVATEDAEAVLLLAEFEDASAAFLAWTDLPSNPDYHTGGIVRALCKRANGMCERDPRYALVLAESAVAIAAMLPESAYPAAALHEWRGEAWKEQANALHHLGRFDEAWTAIGNAEIEYGGLKHAGIGQVAVTYIRAVLLYEKEEYEAAASLAEASSAAALHLGSIDRYMRAQHLHGHIHYRNGDIAGAIERFSGVLRYGEAQGSAVWIGRESLALGNCYLLLGQLREARDSLLNALRSFKSLRFEAEIARTDLGFARLLFAEGARNDAIVRMRKCIADLISFRMVTDAAIGAVYLAEMLDATGRRREVPKVLTGVIQTLARAGKITTALTALAYLRETAKRRGITLEVASHVRQFINRTEYQHQLLFVPPPV
ncbi:MAG TPA: hypothetical protein VGR95_18465 [Thermoanaerobaculia bacterium]|jgi:hypothetical protein|nr:hypothetical protein [Thermoanaerobaculia bacterium]